MASVRKALNSLPATLDETYDRILNNIPSEYRKEAHCILQLVTVCYSTPSLEGLADAVGVDTCSLRFNPDERLADKFDILEICSSLVTLSGYGLHPLALFVQINPVGKTEQSYVLHITQ